MMERKALGYVGRSAIWTLQLTVIFPYNTFFFSVVVADIRKYGIGQ
jgi:hypothetical protein